MNIFVNDEAIETEEGLHLAQLLERLELPNPHFAVEINQQLIPREVHASHLLSEGDRIEVVTLVGGG